MPFNIKERREELGLTLEEIGQFVGVGKGTVAKWESGFIKNMRRDKIVKLAKILRVSPMEFLKEDIGSRPNMLQKKVYLCEDVKCKYEKFTLSVFGTIHTEPTAIICKDNSLVLLSLKDDLLKEFFDGINRTSAEITKK